MDGHPLDIDPTVRGIPVDNATLNDARRIWNDRLLNLPMNHPIKLTLHMINGLGFPPNLELVT
jgi:hypothetical protein